MNVLLKLVKYVAFLLPAGLIFAEQGLQNSFGYYFERQHDYYRAATEYQREAFLADNRELQNKLRLRAAENLFAAEQYALVIREIEQIPVTPQSSWLAYFSSLQLKQFARSASILQGLPEPISRHEHSLLQLHSAAELPIKNPDQGLLFQSDIENLQFPAYLAAPILTFSSATDWQEILPEKREKSQILGALAALFPGGGYFYAGAYGDGFSSLAVISFFAISSIVAFENSEVLTGTLLATGGAIFYGGGIYGGIRAVNIHNRQLREEFKERLFLMGFRYSVFSD